MDPMPVYALMFSIVCWAVVGTRPSQSSADASTDPVLLPREAAQLLRMSEQTLYRLTRSGEIPVVRYGKRNVRYMRRTLESWAEQREQRAGLQHVTESAK